MPEIKHQFTGGKMEKDLDERLVPNGDYRDAMNIQVETSEGSEVGTAQNILGNRIVDICGLYSGNALLEGSVAVGSISDEKVDTLYWLVWTLEVDYIISYKSNDINAELVFVDIKPNVGGIFEKNVLRFDPNNIITGINIIDGMLFWTDDENEPRKINIERCKEGTITSAGNLNHTRLINKNRGITFSSNILIEEKHITVIKKGPVTPLGLGLETFRDPNKIYTGVVTITTPPTVGTGNLSSLGTLATEPYDFSHLSVEEGNNKFGIEIVEAIDSTGTVIGIGGINTLSGLTGWHSDPLLPGAAIGQFSIPLGTKVVLKPFDISIDGTTQTPPGLPVTDYVIKAVVIQPSGYAAAGIAATTGVTWAMLKIMSIDGYPPVVEEGQEELKYVIDLWDESEKLFEFKFPRFSYRYKFEDGEYSTFAPWTQVAFKPGAFDYHPRKGYNLGMTNRVNKVKLYGLVNSITPKDVASIDILFKDEPSPNIYIVDTIRQDDFESMPGSNKWNTILSTNGPYTIEKETINSIVPSNQLLRPWDNVPRKALAQDISGNRIIYGNYLQNYNVITTNGKYVPAFVINEDKEYPETVYDSLQDQVINTRLSGAGKSIKSLREYQLGVVFTDKYGRETPVISNESGTLRLEKDKADKYNRVEVGFANPANFPIGNDLKYFKFYIKETSGEYYNMAMDRWYDAEDGNVWIAFPSSDRNKLDIDTFLILKKGSDTDILVSQAARYKVIAIENEAPDFIKTKRSLGVSLTHSTTANLYGTALGNGPAQGRDEFEINYQAFYGSAGMHLDEYKKGELYIEWEVGTTNQVSDRYRIISIEHDFDKEKDGEGIQITESPKYTIQLDRNLSSDVNFITDDASGQNPSKIVYGVRTNIYKYTVENSPKFDGRFFVKIYEDETFQTNIGKSFKEGLDYRVLNSKKIYYMHPKHRKMHTDDLDNFLTHNNTISSDNPVAIADPNHTNKWGYYAVKEFASMALFFRRYAYKTEVYTAGSSGLAAGILAGTHAIPLLAQLKPGIGNDYGSGINGSTTLNRTYSPDLDNPNWTPVKDWHKEYGINHPTQYVDMWDKGYTNWFDYNPPTETIYQIGATETATGSVAKTGVQEADLPRDTEVWFIDGGPRAGTAYSYPHNNNVDLNWGSQHRYETYPYDQLFLNYPGSYTVPGSNFGYFEGLEQIQDGAVNNSGIVNSTGGHSMVISFGGIKGATSHFSNPGDDIYWGNSPSYGAKAGLFNIGNWYTTSNEALNPNYNDSNLDTFVSNFAPEVQFRWKEDPTETKYTIGGQIGVAGYLRHSTYRTQWIWRKSIIQPQPQYWKHYGATSMAEALSFNFSRGWGFADIVPSYTGNWDPLTNGEIANGLVINIPAVNNSGISFPGTPGTMATGDTITDDLEIFVQTLVGLATDTPFESATLKVGMALKSYTPANSPSSSASVNSILGGNEEFLVIRKITNIYNTDGTISHYALMLGGYHKPLQDAEHQMANPAGTKMAVPGENYTFVQVGMNGYSHNSEFNINTMAHNVPGATYGAITAVGYNIEFIEYIEPEEILSENPAIFETEPKDTKDLEIYYEASTNIPINFDTETITEAFPIKSSLSDAFGALYTIVGYNSNQVLVQSTPYDPTTPVDYNAVLPVGNISILRPDNILFSPVIQSVQNITVPGLGACGSIIFAPLLYGLDYSLNWHNCYSFGNGVESNRIRDNFNLPYIINGVKVSTTLEHEYKEEHRKYGLIYSGIYNSNSGVNNLNQFIQAEKITKDVNPIYGSIQKLHSRDEDLVTLCEDKCLKIMANKDAVFNADGNTNLTATSKVLGQTIPFRGEYGISTNPESFASEAYRAYFTDRVRGAVMRLSIDGLTPISEFGMKDWFKDNLKLVRDGKIIGSYDDRNDEYVVKLEFSETSTYDESCATHIFGCTDLHADNYDASATVDDGSCYTTIYGCMDPLALNYNVYATVGDESCISIVYGCFNPSASNYSGPGSGVIPEANTSDDSLCIFLEGPTIG